MPSTIVGFMSGGQPLVSGNFFSGRPGPAVVRLTAWPSNSGSVYVGLSGGMTITSGGFFLSGGGLLDGMPLKPGDTYSVPRPLLGASGSTRIYLACDAECSGQARVYWEAT